METRAMDSLLAQLRSASALAGGKRVEPAPTTTPKSDFASTLKTALDQVNQTQQQSTRMARDFETGVGNHQLHDVMIAMQKANISLQQTVQVRNRLVSAYHDIMNMQV